MTTVENTINKVNPVTLGTLYFSFAISLWSSDQINTCQIKGIAIFCTTISVILFITVFSEYLLSAFSKWVQKPLILLPFVLFLVGFISGWLQAFLQTSGTISTVILYFGFAWTVVFLLTLVRDTAKQGKIKRFFNISIIAAFIIIAVINFYNHDLWSGGYLIVIAILAFLVTMDWLKVHGGIFE